MAPEIHLFKNLQETFKSMALDDSPQLYSIFNTEDVFDFHKSSFTNANKMAPQRGHLCFVNATITDHKKNNYDTLFSTVF